MAVQGTYAGGQDASSTFSYDILGNMRTRGDSGLYRLSYLGHPYRPSLAVVGGDGYLGFSWDGAGNLVEAGSSAYSYDGFGRLATSTYYRDDLFTDTFGYGHAGGRVYRTHGLSGDPSSTVATYQLGTYEEGSDGAARLFLDAPSRRLAQVSVDASSTAALQYLHPDALGSSPLGTDAAGEPASLVDQDPYGLRALEKLAGALPSPTRSFTGKELDPSSWYYFGSRYMDPQMGRFTQVDPVTLGLGRMRPAELAGLLSDPRRLHPYAYAANNPMKYRDPDGEFFDVVLDIGFIAYDLYRIGSQLATQGHLQKGELLALAADVGGAIVPGATGLGVIARTAMHADDVAKVAKTVTRATEAVESGNRVTHTLIKASQDTLDHVMNPTLKKGGAISGGHYRPNLEKAGADMTGLSYDISSRVPFKKFGNQLKTLFVDGFTPKQIEAAGDQLQYYTSRSSLPMGSYSRYMEGHLYRYIVDDYGVVQTFMHAIPRHIP